MWRIVMWRPVMQRAGAAQQQLLPGGRIDMVLEDQFQALFDQAAEVCRVVWRLHCEAIIGGWIFGGTGPYPATHPDSDSQTNEQAAREHDNLLEQ
jgi:hypothetical protein